MRILFEREKKSRLFCWKMRKWPKQRQTDARYQRRTFKITTSKIREKDIVRACVFVCVWVGSREIETMRVRERGRERESWKFYNAFLSIRRCTQNVVSIILLKFETSLIIKEWRTPSTLNCSRWCNNFCWKKTYDPLYQNIGFKTWHFEIFNLRYFKARDNLSTSNTP